MGIALASAARSAAVSASGFEGTLPPALSTPDLGLAKGARSAGRPHDRTGASPMWPP
jgi:hypothetical protein